MRVLAITHTKHHGDEAVFSAGDGLRIGFGVIWVIDAAFKWTPTFRHGFTETLKSAAQGQPGWLHGWFHLWINLVQSRSDFFAYSTAVAETLIAVALILGFARKATYIGAALFSVMIRATAEGFGGPYSSSSTDIGAAVMYAVVFMPACAQLRGRTQPFQRGLLHRAARVLVASHRRGRQGAAPQPTDGSPRCLHGR